MADHGPQERTYRRLVRSPLRFTRVTVQETDLGIYADADVTERAKELVLEHRGYLEAYLRRHADFHDSLVPLEPDALAPPMVQEMLEAGQLAGVGPMAAVAGAMAEQVGRGLLDAAEEVIVENGGDVFIQSRRALTIGLFAGDSPLSMKIGLRLQPSQGPAAVCTSSGTVGHSLSMGAAHAACVVSSSCARADAAATAIGNRVRGADDIGPAVQWGREIPGVDGILIVIGDKMGMWGKVELVTL